MASGIPGGVMRMQIVAVAMSATVFGGGAAIAQVETEVDRKPDWLRAPRPSDVISVWPKAAWRLGIGGRAIIRCKVSAQGTLFDCWVRDETPVGVDFGSAALTLAPQLVLRPAMKGGKAVAYDGIDIPIDFQTPDAQIGSNLRRRVLPLLPSRMLSDVPWRRAPSYANVLAAYPARAKKESVGGHASLACKFRSDGQLTACDVINETPTGYGFGAAARSLMDRFQGPDGGGDGQPTAGDYTQVSVTFAPEMLSADKPVTGKPKWIGMPPGAAFEGAFTPLAKAAGVTTVRAMLECVVQPDGGLASCTTLSEEPAGQGIGAAALGLAPGFRLAAWTTEGLAIVGTTVRLPLRYSVPAAKP